MAMFRSCIRIPFL